MQEALKLLCVSKCNVFEFRFIFSFLSFILSLPPLISCRHDDNKQLSGIVNHSSLYFVLITHEHQDRVQGGSRQ